MTQPHDKEGDTDDAGSARNGLGLMPYESFLAERQKIVEARQHAQQRTEHIVVAGAAGALVLSTTFLNRFVPSPHPAVAVCFLVAGWGLLLLSLLLSFCGTFASQIAFDVFLKEFDFAYEKDRDFNATNRTAVISRVLTWASAGFFIVGIASLAWFAYQNLNLGP